jgi:hypothetical protein
MGRAPLLSMLFVFAVVFAANAKPNHPVSVKVIRTHIGAGSGLLGFGGSSVWEQINITTADNAEGKPYTVVCKNDCNFIGLGHHDWPVLSPGAYQGEIEEPFRKGKTINILVNDPNDGGKLRKMNFDFFSEGWPLDWEGVSP